MHLVHITSKQPLSLFVIIQSLAHLRNFVSNIHMCSFTYLPRQYFTSPRAEQASQWQKTMVVSILLFPGIVVIVNCALNAIAVYYDTVNAIPALVIVKMIGIWLFVALPLAVVGTIFGRHLVGKADFPCRVNSIPRYDYHYHDE